MRNFLDGNAVFGAQLRNQTKNPGSRREHQTADRGEQRVDALRPEHRPQVEKDLEIRESSNIDDRVGGGLDCIVLLIRHSELQHRRNFTYLIGKPSRGLSVIRNNVCIAAPGSRYRVFIEFELNKNSSMHANDFAIAIENFHNGTVAWIPRILQVFPVKGPVGIPRISMPEGLLDRGDSQPLVAGAVPSVSVGRTILRPMMNLKVLRSRYRTGR